MPHPPRALECPSPPSCAPGAVLVETARLVLRRFQPSDAPLLARAANHRTVWDGVRDKLPRTRTRSPMCRRICGGGTPRRPGGNVVAQQEVLRHYPTKVAVCVKTSPAGNETTEARHELVGCIGADPGRDVLARNLGSWATGYATEATPALLRWLLRTWPGAHRVQALTLASNPRSANVLAKCGFALEGVQREAAEKDGVLQDLHVYAVLRRDVNLAE